MFLSKDLKVCSQSFHPTSITTTTYSSTMGRYTMCMASILPSPSEVPLEVWDTILKFACARGDTAVSDARRISLTPFVMSHVCSAWRARSVSTPGLWSEISLSVSSTAHFPNLNLLYLILERSRDRPLPVNLEITGHNMILQPEVHAFLLLLITNSTRWKTATLDLDFRKIDAGSWEEFHSAFGNAPLLESLDLTVGLIEDIEPVDVLQLRLWLHSLAHSKIAVKVGDMPKKAKGRGYVSDVIYPDWAVENGIPYHQISHLLLEGRGDTVIGWTEITSIFETAPNLVSCSLQGFCNANPSFQPTVTLQHLQHFDLKANENFYDRLVAGLNRHLTAPSLRTLSLANATRWSQREYTEFIQRSACLLEDLHLVPYNMDNANLLECMRLSPTLQILNAYPEDMFISEFTDRMANWDDAVGEFDICPNLQQLSIPDISSPPIQTSLVHFVEMVRKRRFPPNGSPGKFTTLVTSPSDDDDGDHLQSLLDNLRGVEVTHDDPIPRPRSVATNQHIQWESNVNHAGTEY